MAERKGSSLGSAPASPSEPGQAIPGLPFESLPRLEALQRKKPTLSRLFALYGGEEGIRTLVGICVPHPISSRRRYDRFGTSPGCCCAAFADDLYAAAGAQNRGAGARTVILAASPPDRRPIFRNWPQSHGALRQAARN